MDVEAETSNMKTGGVVEVAEGGRMSSLEAEPTRVAVAISIGLWPRKAAERAWAVTMNKRHTVYSEDEAERKEYDKT
jgi:hypothetical protein